MERLGWRDLAYTTIMTTMERLTEKVRFDPPEARPGLRLHVRLQPRGIRGKAVRQIIGEVLDGDARGLAGALR